MSYIERDPRDLCFAALYLSIKNYTVLSPEQATKIVLGKVKPIFSKKMTPEILARIEQIMDNPNFKNFTNIEKTFKINRYDVNPGGVEVAQVDMWVKRLVAHAEGCAGDCGKCVLDTIITDDKTFCEILCDLEEKNATSKENQVVQKSAKKCTELKCEGKTGKRGFEIYRNVLDVFGGYLVKHSNRKVKDIVSSALAEYMARHK